MEEDKQNIQNEQFLNTFKVEANELADELEKLFGNGPVSPTENAVLRGAMKYEVKMVEVTIKL